VSRRKFWGIIKELKQEQTIIFTTQFLDEAEELSDRLAVLSKGTLFLRKIHSKFLGKLLSLGGVGYVKRTFGEGYTLILENSKNPTKIRSQAEEIASKIKIKTHIPSAFLSQTETSLNFIQYVLPYGEQKQFSELFSDLEKMKEIQVEFFQIFFKL